MSKKLYWVLILLLAAALFLPSAALAVTHYISNADDLNYLSAQVAAGVTYAGDIVELTDSITLDGSTWVPIGNTTTAYFMGTFDGRGYTISFLSDVSSDFNMVGLFGYIGSSGVVKNLHVRGNMSTNSNSTSSHIGGIAGYSNGTVFNCSFSGNIAGIRYSGGLTGGGTGSLYNSYHEGTVQSSIGYAGGLIGNCVAGSVENCYSAGTVNGVCPGGLIGELISSCSIKNCYMLNTACDDFIGNDASHNDTSSLVCFDIGSQLIPPHIGLLMEALNTGLTSPLNAGWDYWAEPGSSPYPVFRTLSPDKASVSFASAETGYEAPTAETVRITNEGRHDVTLSTLPVLSNFTVAGPAGMSLAIGGSADITVWPKPGLKVGSYDETIAIGDTEGHAAKFHAVFSVMAKAISAASVEGIQAPSAGSIPVISLESVIPGHASYTVTKIVWQNGDGTPATLVNGRFRAGSAYMAEIELTSAAGYKFPSGGLTPSVNKGTPQLGKVDGGDAEGNTLTFDVTFLGTAALTLTGITVDTQPSDLDYIEGEILNLAGLLARLTYNDTSEETVALMQFASKDITAVPADGTVLTAAAHHGQQVAVNVKGFAAYTASLTVAAATYAISANPSSLNLGSVIEGYSSSPTAQTVTVTNTGNSSLTLSTPTNASFDITALDALSIAPDETARFEVRPKTGLDAGTYSDTITFNTTGAASVSIAVSFTVQSAVYAVDADTNSLSFSSVIEGYSSSPAARTVTVTNTGNSSLTLSTPTNASFDITALDALAIAPDGTARFEVRPKTGLDAGTYSDTITFNTTGAASISVTVSFTVQSAVYAVEADTNSLSFSSVIEGYSSSPAAQTVTVTNTGNKDVTLNTPVNTHYDIAALDALTLAPAGTTRFEVRPKTGLDAGTYSETITFNTTSAASVSITSSFTVQSASFAITAGPALVSFADAAQGYHLPAVQTVTVNNTGNQPVTLIQPTAADFTLGMLSKITIAPLESATFTLQPKSGLKEGSYLETIVIQGLSGAAASVDVRFTVTAVPSFQISASPSALDFGSLAEGYIHPAVQTVTITNTGNQSISLYQPTATHFDIGMLSKTTLAPLDTASFTVTPKTGLSAGVWNEAIRILGSQGVSIKADAAFTCTVPIGYSILSGDGSSFLQDEPGAHSLTITANGSMHKFTGLKLNGEFVDESNYDVSEGSTIVTLHKDYLDALQPGTYTLRFQYTDGFAEAGFVVQDHMPATGDNDVLLLFGSLIALSLTAILLLRRKAVRR